MHYLCLILTLQYYFLPLFLWNRPHTLRRSITWWTWEGVLLHEVAKAKNRRRAEQYEALVSRNPLQDACNQPNLIHSCTRLDSNTHIQRWSLLKALNFQNCSVNRRAFRLRSTQICYRRCGTRATVFCATLVKENRKNEIIQRTRTRNME